MTEYNKLFPFYYFTIDKYTQYVCMYVDMYYYMYMYSINVIKVYSLIQSDSPLVTYTSSTRTVLYSTHS